MAGKTVSFSEEERNALRAAFRQYVKDNELTQTAAGDAIGMAQQNAGRLLGSSPDVGMGRKAANLLAVRLGYQNAEHFLKEHGVLAELQAERSGAEWAVRDASVRIAKHLDINEAAVRNVVARYARNEDLHRPMKWWIGKFREEEVEMAAEAQSPQQLPQAIRPAVPKAGAKSKPRRHRETG